LIVAVLLLCHGAFGYAHQLTLSEAPQTSSAHSKHAIPGHGASHSSGATDEHSVSGGYFATLLALLFSVLLLLGGRLSPSVRLPAPASFRRGVPRLVFHPPRDHIAPLLGVFRL